MKNISSKLYVENFKGGIYRGCSGRYRKQGITKIGGEGGSQTPCVSN